MKKLAILPVLGLTLSAGMCKTTEPAVEIRTVEVVKEVQKPCPGETPIRPTPLGTLSADARQALAQVGAKLTEYAGKGQYADKAEAYFKTCPPAGR